MQCASRYSYSPITSFPFHAIFSTMIDAPFAPVLGVILTSCTHWSLSLRVCCESRMPATSWHSWPWTNLKVLLNPNPNLTTTLTLSNLQLKPWNIIRFAEVCGSWQNSFHLRDGRGTHCYFCISPILRSPFSWYFRCLRYSIRTKMASLIVSSLF